MREREPLDPAEATRTIQEAVRTHDGDRLNELVSDRFIFASSRSISRLGESGYGERPGKSDWIRAARLVDWREFTVDHLRSLDVGGVVVIDLRLTQVARLHDAWTQSSWVVTDVWAIESGVWRLIARHAELAREP